VVAVYIANRNHLHASYAILALQAGKHVLIEKPIALNSADEMNVAKSAESSGV
jgi:predicted dehydrogenase